MSSPTGPPAEMPDASRRWATMIDRALSSMGMLRGSFCSPSPNATKQRCGSVPTRNGKPRNCCGPMGAVPCSPRSASPAFWNAIRSIGVYSSICLLLRVFYRTRLLYERPRVGGRETIPHNIQLHLHFSPLCAGTTCSGRIAVLRAILAQIQVVCLPPVHVDRLRKSSRFCLAFGGDELPKKDQLCDF